MSYKPKLILNFLWFGQRYSLILIIRNEVYLLSFKKFSHEIGVRANEESVSQRVLKAHL